MLQPASLFCFRMAGYDPIDTGSSQDGHRDENKIAELQAHRDVDTGQLKRDRVKRDDQVVRYDICHQDHPGDQGELLGSGQIAVLIHTVILPANTLMVKYSVL